MKSRSVCSLKGDIDQCWHIVFANFMKTIVPEIGWVVRIQEEMFPRELRSPGSAKPNVVAILSIGKNKSWFEMELISFTPWNAYLININKPKLYFGPNTK